MVTESLGTLVWSWILWVVVNSFISPVTETGRQQTTRIKNLVPGNNIQGNSIVYTIIVARPSMQTFFLLVTKSFHPKKCATSVTSQMNASEGGWPSLSFKENGARRKRTTIVSDPCLNICEILGYYIVVEHPSCAWKVRGFFQIPEFRAFLALIDNFIMIPVLYFWQGYEMPVRVTWDLM